MTAAETKLEDHDDEITGLKQEIKSILVQHRTYDDQIWVLKNVKADKDDLDEVVAKLKIMDDEYDDIMKWIKQKEIKIKKLEDEFKNFMKIVGGKKGNIDFKVSQALEDTVRWSYSRSRSWRKSSKSTETMSSCSYQQSSKPCQPRLTE